MNHIRKIYPAAEVRPLGNRTRKTRGKVYHALFGIIREGRDAESVEYERHYPAEQWTEAEADEHSGISVKAEEEPESNVRILAAVRLLQRRIH